MIHYDRAVIVKALLAVVIASMPMTQKPLLAAGLSDQHVLKPAGSFFHGKMSPTFVSATQDAYEPDNIPEQAHVIDAVSQQRSIFPIGDQDWVSFTLPYTAGVVLDTSGLSGSTSIALFGASNTSVPIVVASQGGIGNFARLTINCATPQRLRPGTYYARITQKDGNAVIDAYKLTLSVDLCLPFNVSPNELHYFGHEGVSDVITSTFSIVKSTPLTTAWSVAVNGVQPGWLSLSPVSGSFSNLFTPTVNVSVNTTGLTAGVYSTTMSVIGGSPFARQVYADLYISPPLSACRGEPADLALAMDISDSMTGRPFSVAKSAAHTLVDHLDFRFDQMAFVAFNGISTLSQPLTRDTAALYFAIDAQVVGGGTDLVSALRTASAELEGIRHNPGNTAVIILFSDGKHAAAGDPVSEAAIAKAKGQRIIVVGMGNVDVAVLKSVASSESDFYYTPDEGALGLIFVRIGTSIGCKGPQLYVPMVMR